MGRQPKKGTPQVRKLTERQKQQAEDTTNAIRGMKKVVKGGIVRWIPIRKD
jgi:hypothetical protein